MAAKPVKESLLGPQKGSPPSLEWVGVDRLSVDPSYQRATDSDASRRIIVGMVKAWDWALCQPLVVSRRADGGLFILDGQHRHAGARERGDIAHLPCVVLGSIALSEEAETFVALNERRQRLSQSDIFFAMLAAGDPNARRAQELMEATGWQVIRHRPTNAYGPGDLGCAPMLVRQLQEKGEDAVRFGLATLRAAYPDRAVRPGSTMLKALFYLFVNLLEPQDSSAAIVAALAKDSPENWLLQGAIFHERHPTLSGTAALARVIIDRARGKAGAASAALPPPSRAPLAATPTATATGPRPRPAAELTPAQRALARSGKSFCDQCDQMATQARVDACRDAHCVLKR